MGQFAPPFWAGRRVLVTAAATPLGRQLVGELLARRAGVVALLGRTDSPAGLGRVVTVRGRAEDHSRLTSAMVLHGVQTVFHLADDGLAAVQLAARLAGDLEVIVPPMCTDDPVGDLLWRAESLSAA